MKYAVIFLRVTNLLINIYSIPNIFKTQCQLFGKIQEISLTSSLSLGFSVAPWYLRGWERKTNTKEIKIWILNLTWGPWWSSLTIDSALIANSQAILKVKVISHVSVNFHSLFPLTETVPCMLLLPRHPSFFFS